MATPLTVSADRHEDGTPLLVAAGEIDLSNVDTFSRALSTVVDGAGGPVTVDLSAVEYLDSAAIGALTVHADQMPGLRLLANPYLIPVLRISGIDQLATVESAGRDGEPGPG
ncbi:STAS domain-containing protein [Mycolicibacterium litorale]|uniref:Anti-anti-sigma factor n=1 Tax=Mycolicibacterium litorale TaxID=758802 RepID=A0AAD1MW79_9MYCO|nr:STAS domain-containing protein [Mycolicibacterium litorale]MCV7416994.1 STAS domain-containing protein [Mycolicibacterium litorale]TDY04780.1 anti-sigma-factor antagonist [Mycolicibacterium litorale]BBY18207.1 anti-anti-sigma factor [Mycolicibacterium litorale]